MGTMKHLAVVLVLLLAACSSSSTAAPKVTTTSTTEAGPGAGVPPIVGSTMAQMCESLRRLVNSEPGSEYAIRIARESAARLRAPLGTNVATVVDGLAKVDRGEISDAQEGHDPAYKAALPSVVVACITAGFPIS